MPQFLVPVVAALVLAAPALRPSAAARADDGTAPAPPDAFEMTDRRKILSIKLPRSWRALTESESEKFGVNPNDLAAFTEFSESPGKSPNGVLELNVAGDFERALLARCVDLPLHGTVKAGTMRQGPGWAEGCVEDDRSACIFRYLEKNGHAYRFALSMAGGAYDSVHAAAEHMLNSAAVPGDFAPVDPGANFKSKSAGEFEYRTDADPDRETSIKRALAQLATARDAVQKILPGKPFDPSKPVAWIFQNGTKYDDRVKDAVGVAKEFAAFDGRDHCVLCSILSDSAQGHDEAVYAAGAAQYSFQYFGGVAPIWLAGGLSNYGELVALSGKGRLTPDVVLKAKTAVAQGKRRLDQWFDLASWNEVTDNDQGARELFAWQWYFHNGHGAQKYRKQFEGYVKSLREVGDPAVARKAFDGVNFDEMLQDFKSWAAEWK